MPRSRPEAPWAQPLSTPSPRARRCRTSPFTARRPRRGPPAPSMATRRRSPSAPSCWRWRPLRPSPSSGDGPGRPRRWLRLTTRPWRWLPSERRRPRPPATRWYDRLLADDLDGVLGAVGHGEPCLLLEFGRHDVDDDRRLLVVVDVEDLGRQPVAAGMALTLVWVDADLH